MLEDLLGFLMGALDEEELERLSRALDEDAELRRQIAVLRRRYCHWSFATNGSKRQPAWRRGPGSSCGNRSCAFRGPWGLSMLRRPAAAVERLSGGADGGAAVPNARRERPGPALSSTRTPRPEASFKERERLVLRAGSFVFQERGERGAQFGLVH